MAEWIHIPSGMAVTAAEGVELPAALFRRADAQVAEPTKRELLARAAELGLEFPSKATKAQVAEAIAEELAVREAVAGQDGPASDPRRPKGRA